VQLAAVAEVRRLVLTHHDPSHDDAFFAYIEQRAQQLVQRLGSGMEVRCAYEGFDILVERSPVLKSESAHYSS
jgi:hypothetical protein